LHNGEEIVVSGPKFFVGRDRDCQLRPNSDVVSRHHCALVVEPGYVAVRDFNSKNGTFVDGKRVVGEQELRSGSELVVGPLRFLVQLDVSLGGKKRAPVKDMEEAAARTAQLAEGEDENIDDWLDDTDPSGSDTGLVADQGAKLRRTDPSHAGGDDKILAGDTVKTEQTNPAAPLDSAHRPDESGKLPRPDDSKPKSADTQSAVVDALRKLREKRQQKK
jgi:pSer/pThr/pTyr-binding forkhead associated (FHA) protein